MHDFEAETADQICAAESEVERLRERAAALEADVLRLRSEIALALACTEQAQHIAAKAEAELDAITAALDGQPLPPDAGERVRLAAAGGRYVPRDEDRLFEPLCSALFAAGATKEQAIEELTKAMSRWNKQALRLALYQPPAPIVVDGTRLVPVPDATPAPAEDDGLTASSDRCLRCGSTNLVGIGCASCGWTGEPVEEDDGLRPEERAAGWRWIVDGSKRFLERYGFDAAFAIVDLEGWRARDGKGPETGAAGQRAAVAHMRKAGVL